MQCSKLVSLPYATRQATIDAQVGILPRAGSCALRVCFLVWAQIFEQRLHELPKYFWRAGPLVRIMSSKHTNESCEGQCAAIRANRESSLRLVTLCAKIDGPGAARNVEDDGSMEASRQRSFLARSRVGGHGGALKLS